MKKVFLEISQNSQENTCARVPFLIKLQAPGNMEIVFFLSCISEHNMKLLEVTRRISVKNVFIKISQNLQENTCATVSNLQLYLKRGSGTSVIL